MIEIERVCKNCKHWSGGVNSTHALCRIHAVDPDVGLEAKAVVLLPPRATCLVYDDAFEPSDDCIAYLRAVETSDEWQGVCL